MKLRWLGCAGYEIVTEKNTFLYVDPWLTSHFNAPISVSDIEKADAVLLTHAHFDHAEDVPEIVKRTEAKLLASQSEIDGLSQIERLPKEQLTPVQWGDTVRVRGCKIYVTKAKHLTSDKLAVVFLGHSISPSSDGGVDLSSAMAQEIPSIKEQRKISSKFREKIKEISPKGFIITTENGLRIWHLGSCVPIPELEKYSEEFRPQIAILQVPANLEDSIGLEIVKLICSGGNGPSIILPHHHDKIYEDQPTVTNVELFRKHVQKTFPELKVLNPELGRYYHFELKYD